MASRVISLTGRVLRQQSTVMRGGSQHFVSNRTPSSDPLFKILNQSPDSPVKFMCNSPDTKEAEDRLVKLDHRMMDLEEIGREMRSVERTIFKEFCSVAAKYRKGTLELKAKTENMKYFAINRRVVGFGLLFLCLRYFL